MFIHPFTQANETAILNQMRSEMLAQEELYSKLRREFEIMEADFKQTVAHNEQAGPINSEMRSLITTLQLQNKQLKNEVVRYRRKSKESAHDCQLVSEDAQSTFRVLLLRSPCLGWFGGRASTYTSGSLTAST